jgi:hypothetical protein
MNGNCGEKFVNLQGKGIKNGSWSLAKFKG